MPTPSPAASPIASPVANGTATPTASPSEDDSETEIRPEDAGTGLDSAAVPSEARVNDPGGAGAFGRFYFDQVIKALGTHDASIIRALATPSCWSCANFNSSVDYLHSKQFRLTAPWWEILSAEAPGFTGGPISVDIGYQALSYKVIDAKGAVVMPGDVSRPRSFYTMTLERTATGWLVDHIQGSSD